MDENILSFIEENLLLIPLGPRKYGFNVLDNTDINEKNARLLAETADRCWEAILSKNAAAFGEGIKDGFYGQVNMFPNMMNNTLQELIKKYKDVVYGWKVSGAGGGGYLIIVPKKRIEEGINIKIRRPGN